MTWKRIWIVLFFLWNILREMNYFSMPWTQVESEMQYQQWRDCSFGDVPLNQRIISCVVSCAKKLLKGYNFKNTISAVRMSTIDNIFSMLLYWFEFHPGSYAEILIFLIVFNMSLLPNLWFLVDYIDKHTHIRLSHMILWVVMKMFLKVYFDTQSWIVYVLSHFIIFSIYIY